ncbi:fibronectin type III domain-containing protein [Aequorivita sp. CIP111184]|uniref:fibronectin type III domain-containing protein n=1 Tax=Aequorivita sp. CIP111184 TaxID=2211356 RepID=UPI000DBBEE18|nr:hypothetical protein [Aequorivita sp. CIP111184]SRX52624.1 hypothetical protein AEQU1_00491 [Aequorivita sp. CIP111184]
MKTSKTYNLIWSCILLLFVAACSEDDPNTGNTTPSAFEVTITEIRNTTSKVAWTASTTGVPTTITYAIFLNDSLLIENLTETTYNLSNLAIATTYTVKVEAKNEYSTTSASKDFTTLQPTNLRLKSYNQGNYEFILNYNAQGLLTYRGNPSPIGYTNIDFTYNQNNEILTENSKYRDATGNPKGILTYEYSNTTLTGLTIQQTGEDFSADSDFQFDAPLNYRYTVNGEILTGGPPEVFNYNYEVTLETDSNNKITKYTRLNTDDSHVDRVYFEYDNGNLTKLTNGSNITEITYDEANNWHTYRSGFNPSFYSPAARDIGGFIYYPNTLYWLNQIPYFFNFNNKNNPTAYKVNGEVVTSFQYEYNAANYPSKITIPQQNVVIDLEYEAVD